MLNVISAIVSGLVIGILARFFYPGAVVMGWIATILLGIAGSLLAGLVTSRGNTDFSRAGFIASVIGAMALIFIGHLVAR
jgi:uncharacterized membrane protein YeaQ/YmgE (transglycosylase-associated protein family)